MRADPALTWVILIEMCLFEQRRTERVPVGATPAGARLVGAAGRLARRDLTPSSLRGWYPWMNNFCFSEIAAIVRMMEMGEEERPFSQDAAPCGFFKTVNFFQKLIHGNFQSSGVVKT